MLRQAVRFMLDAVLPPVCLCCHAPVAESGALRPRCWSRVEFLAAPQCARCGLPFEFDMGEGALCGDCAATPPLFGRARAVLRYDDASKPLILRLKHGDRLEGVPAFARWLARAGADVLEGADLLVPVPLHRWRLFARRYNQAALLAMALSRQSSIPAIPDLLLRHRRTPPQGHLGGAARRRNVAGAFAVHPRHAAALRGRRAVLVDDVMTSGATLEECTRVLLKGGAASVDVLTLARVVKAD